MYLKEIKLFMSRAYGPGSYDPAYEKQGQDYPVSYLRWTERRNFDEFLRLVQHGQVDLRPLITHQFTLEDAAKGYQAIMDPNSNSLAVLLRYPSDSDSSLIDLRPKRKVHLTGQHVTGATNSSQLGVALVGAGNLARWAHLPILTKLPCVTLRAVHSQSGARGKSYARRFGAAYCCSDYEEILQDPKVDLVVITSRHQHHAAQANAALRAGKHVFVEKPMALTVDECRGLCQAVKDSGRQLTVGFNRRFAPFYLEMKRSLKGRPGPSVINCRVNSPGISGSYWMADPAIGGAILGEACHFVDLMHWFLESEPIIVSAISLPADRKEPVGENNIVASFRFADGSIGNLTYCTVGSSTSGGERVELYAAGVGAVVEDFKRLKVNTNKRRAKSNWWPEKGYDAQMKSFLTRIQEEREPEVTVHDGVRATVACLRMLESARTLRPCAIDLDSVAVS
jgi:predicted dehydrogenase